MKTQTAGNILFSSKGILSYYYLLYYIHIQYYSILITDIYIIYIPYHSGAEGRNQTYTIWLCLAEHACLILSTVRWARHGEFPWWPALECYQSAIEVILRRYNQSENTTTTSSSSSTARIYKNPNQRKNSTTSSISYLWYYFFGDDSYSYLPREDSRYILPFYVKSRDSRIYAGKVTFFLLFLLFVWLFSLLMYVLYYILSYILYFVVYILIYNMFNVQLQHYIKYTYNTLFHYCNISAQHYIIY